METLHAINAWLSQSYRFQISNGQCLSFVAFFVATMIIIEIPRVQRWIGRVCDAYKIY